MLTPEPTQMVELYCVNHPDKRWMTKNIAPIGCRTIFYNLDYDPKMGRECDCPVSTLRPVFYKEEQHAPNT